MKILHLSDLHLGKRLNEFSLIEDQRFILLKILQIIDEEKPEAVILAGDIYDKAIPSAEAVELFDDFLVRLSRRHVQVFVISGNHDSAERIAFAGRIMEAGGIHMSPVYNGTVEPIALTDEFGTLNVYMLPFVKPTHVKRYFEVDGQDPLEIHSYTDAMRVAVNAMKIDPAVRNVLVTHQFVTGAMRSESEELSVGGTDNVDASVFADFDYVALGHIHRPQNVGSEKIRYSGTPLKYSFSEAKDVKSVTVLEFGKKGDLQVRTVPLVPKRDMVELKGTYLELTAKDFYDGTSYPEDYVHITLTDENDIPDAIGKLRIIYPNLMKLDYDNQRTRKNADVTANADVEHKSPLELFEELFELQNNQPMTEEQNEFLQKLIEEIWN